MHLEITNTDNAAFRGDDEPSAEAMTAEVARILRVVAGKILQGHTEGTCRDINGNPVGNWALGPDMPAENEE
jgi:hypothetical protein